jgi:tetratricopeptide (TPR) repeat protein
MFETFRSPKALPYSRKANQSRSDLWGAALRGSALSFAATLLVCAMSPGVNAQQQQRQAQQPQAQDSEAAIDAAREVVQQSPESAKARYALGRALRIAGKNQEAASELLEATSMDPSLYVAYHELSLTKARPQQIDEAIDRLTILKDEKPRDLLLRVALSELLEANGKVYQASRILVDLVYQNAVPEKYVARVNARIHYLLGKAKDTHASEKVAAEDPTEEDSLPPPLPEASLRRNLSASKIKDSKSGQGYGHAPLLP